MRTELIYQIALTLIPKVGPIKAKALLAYCGSPEAVFKEGAKALKKIPEIGEVVVNAIRSGEVFPKAEAEVQFIEKNHIQPIFFTEQNYPDRLRLCDDSPVLLYTKGRMDLKARRIISIVGTRNATAYGKDFCNELLQGIEPYKPLVVSGLAYGIDVAAHKAALDVGLPTVACVAHGLNKIYPAEHRGVASEMLANGGLVTEFVSSIKQSPELFPMRNRLIAGLSDCTIVVETDLKGGSMITAYMAHSYSREVFALPGRKSDKYSLGCNELIRRNVAAILTKPEHLVEYMNWEEEKHPPAKQLPLFQEFSQEENIILDILRQRGKCSIDDLAIATNNPISVLSNTLLNLEFSGAVRSLPGKMYALC